jgi:Cu-Zn family superoxide dismutase
MHEKGDCSSGDGMSAGGHFNPAGKPHGPQSGDHHGGDMPNLKADAFGDARPISRYPACPSAPDRRTSSERA